MSNYKQSSVEWQHVELIRIDYQYAINKITPREYQEQTKNALEQAKAMHKEEMAYCHIDGTEYAIDIMKEKTKSTSTERFEQYYNETFGGNNEQQ